MCKQPSEQRGCVVRHHWQGSTSTYISAVRAEMPSGMVPVSWLSHKTKSLELIEIMKKGNELVHREEDRPRSRGRCQQEARVLRWYSL
jgi:hypothetical protein